MVWIIASIPFWLLGGLFLLGAAGSIQWRQPTSDAEVKQVLTALVLAGILFVIAAKVAT